MDDVIAAQYLPQIPRFCYFGCIGGPGHYLFSSPVVRGREESAIERGNPWGLTIDGKLCPPSQQIEGRALLHHKNGWTALAFWDRSVDHRHGSCSVFLSNQTHGFDAMMVLARQHFPKVIQRFSFAIVPALATTSATGENKT